MSLRESIFKFVEENGRRYHSFNEGSKTRSPLCQTLHAIPDRDLTRLLEYVLPNDEEEQERLGMYALGELKLLTSLTF